MYDFSANTFYHDSFKRDFNVRVESDGHVQWSFGGQFVTLCVLDMSFFPFDTQQCNINLENWAYTGLEVDLSNRTDRIEMLNYDKNGIWDIVGTEIEKENHYYASTGSTPFPEVEFKLSLRRKPKYYILQLVVPCCFIMFVTLGVFWVPPTSGEKVSLAVTVLLALAVFQLVLQEQTPPNSDFTPLLGQLMSAMSETSESLYDMPFVSVIYCLYFQDSLFSG